MTRGRHAHSPYSIPLSGWKDIALRLKDRLAQDRISLIAAGVAFYGLLALFPALTALMALGGLIFEPEQVTEQLQSFASVMPQDAAQIILDQAREVSGAQNAGLGWAFALAFGLALYSASKGMGSLMQGLNVAYSETEERGFLLRLAVTLGLTVLLIIGLLLGITAAIGVPAVLDVISLGQTPETLVAYGRWVVLALLTAFGLAALYRYGPSRQDAKWNWLSLGAFAAAAIWLFASLAFSFYVSTFASYNETFGSLAGVIILLMWLWISAFVILLGAELNAEVEAQTRKDTTTGASSPAGERGAYKADRLGRAKSA